MFENLGFSEILLILIVALVFFGSKKIPEIARGMGKGIAEFRKAMTEVQESIKSEIEKPLEVKSAAPKLEEPKKEEPKKEEPKSEEPKQPEH
jgi:TatA/E family protein of Tat protein translocase